MSGCDISLIDFRKVSMLLFAESICRIFFLLSPRVSLHLDGFGRVLCHLSGYGTLEGGQVSADRLTYIRRSMERRRRRSVSTYDIKPKHDLCADVICAGLLICKYQAGQKWPVPN